MYDGDFILIRCAVLIAVPLSGAILYVHRTDWHELLKRTVDTCKALTTETGRRDLYLEQKHGSEYRQHLAQMWSAKKILCQISENENKLNLALERSLKKQTALQKFAVTNSKSRALNWMLDWQTRKSKVLEKSLQEQRELLGEQQIRLNKLKENCSIALTYKEGLIICERATLAQKNALNIFSELDHSKHNYIFEKMETAVNEKETVGAEIIAFEREKKRNEEIERFTAKIESFIARLESRVAYVCDFFAAMDPRIEQSYSRLKKQQKLAVKMAELSFAEEEKLEREIAAIISSMSSLQTKTEEALKRDNPSLANSLVSKQEFSNTSAQKLAEALREHRLKNKAIWQRLNKIDEIVQRLYINLLLVQILLIQHKDIFEQYKSIAASAQLYLKSNMTVNLTAPISPDLSSDIQALEKRTQMALISDAKHEYDKLRKANNIQLRDKISDVLRKLELEGLLLNAQSKKWEKILAQSQHEGKEEIQAISLLKHMRCTEISRIIDLDIEILSVCFTRLQSKFD